MPTTLVQYLATPSSFENPPATTALHNGSQDAPSTTASKNGSYVQFESLTSKKLRSLVQAMHENSISECMARDAEARTARLEERRLTGLASGNAKTVEAAYTICANKTSRSVHSSSTSQPNSSHKGEIDESNRYSRILASKAKKALTLDAKFDGNQKNRNIFLLHKLPPRSSKLCWGYYHHHNNVTYNVPSARTLKSLNLFTNHGALSILIRSDPSRNGAPCALYLERISMLYILRRSEPRNEPACARLKLHILRRSDPEMKPPCALLKLHILRRAGPRNGSPCALYLEKILMLYTLIGSDPLKTKISFSLQQVLIFSGDRTTTSMPYKSARIDTN